MVILVPETTRSPDIDRQLGQHAQRIEIGDQRRRRPPSTSHHDRNRDAQDAHQRGCGGARRETRVAVAAAHGPIGARGLRIGVWR